MLPVVCILTGVLLAGCGSDKTGKAGSETEESTEKETEHSKQENPGETEKTTEASENVKEAGKVLVVYYSATGNTKTAAEYIADATGGDLFELNPVEAYTKEDLDYNNPDSRVSREHEDENLRKVELVSTSVEHFSDYEEIFIGYPIWWGSAAWPVNQFVENNDFTGKTVIPFCTSASSGLGDSGKSLEKLAGTGDWLEGKRFSSNVSEDEVADWIEGLDLSELK